MDDKRELERGFASQEEVTTEEHSFDELAKGVADGTLSRSKALKSGGAALLGGVLSLFALPPRDADAARRRQLKTLWAVVNADGTIDHSKGVITSESGKANFTGTYNIVFNRNVSGCARVATIDSAGGETGTQVSDPNTVFVQTFNSSGVNTDKEFCLVVHC